ncbi:hypothetical protein RF11_13024 [Thelohanellus kitauei]|uniref:Uncharacterized protein n=1 Tax=Thelohanellus kitauei TaxID=669202 RepID=A0A0C2MXU2_THEKT|nr:hypothetical protein RF11_13024 [Thelohanellus kitauei]
MNTLASGFLMSLGAIQEITEEIHSVNLKTLKCIVIIRNKIVLKKEMRDIYGHLIQSYQKFVTVVHSPEASQELLDRKVLLEMLYKVDMPMIEETDIPAEFIIPTVERDNDEKCEDPASELVNFASLVAKPQRSLYVGLLSSKTFEEYLKASAVREIEIDHQLSLLYDLIKRSDCVNYLLDFINEFPNIVQFNSGLAGKMTEILYVYQYDEWYFGFEFRIGRMIDMLPIRTTSIRYVQQLFEHCSITEDHLNSFILRVYKYFNDIDELTPLNRLIYQRITVILNKGNLEIQVGQPETENRLYRHPTWAIQIKLRDKHGLFKR